MGADVVWEPDQRAAEKWSGQGRTSQTADAASALDGILICHREMTLICLTLSVVLCRWVVANKTGVRVATAWTSSQSVC